MAERLRATIDEGHRLVEDSIKVAVEPAIVSGESDRTSRQPRRPTRSPILDADALKAMILGRPLDEARSILEAVRRRCELEAWPDWVATVPTLEGRVDADARRGRARRDARTVGRPVTRLLGIDLGERRVGVALADGDGSPARPLVTLRRARDIDGDAAALERSSTTHGVDELVVGLPLDASGVEGSQATLTRAWAEAVAADLRCR